MIKIKNFNITTLQQAGKRAMIAPQPQKTVVSREKLNNLTLANSSTPNRAISVCSTRTPQSRSKRDSMVGRNRQPFAAGCFPVLAVSHPVTLYRQTVRSLAVVPENLILELTQMYQFIFAAIRRSDLSNRIYKIRIHADSETAARAVVAREFILIFAGKINLKNTAEIDRTLAKGGYYA